jgi:high-affinity nickel permease
MNCLHDGVTYNILTIQSIQQWYEQYAITAQHVPNADPVLAAIDNITKQLMARAKLTMTQTTGGGATSSLAAAVVAAAAACMAGNY